MGICMADNPGKAERAGRDYLGLLKDIVHQPLARLRCAVPCLVTQEAWDDCRRWVKNLNRPMEILLGQMIEIGLPELHKEAAVFLVETDPAAMIFQIAAHKIKDDNDTPEAAELLKPAPKAPPALLSFERILASKGASNETAREGGGV